MSQEPLGAVVQALRRAVGLRSDRDTSDADLVDRFAITGDEDAFTALLQRHGPLVLGVCRRVLSNTADADDAFQATFLILVRKAGTIRKHASVASWLYGVAYRVSLEARTRAARRRSHEKWASSVGQTDQTDEVAARELRSILDEELEQLPQKYRLRSSVPDRSRCDTPRKSRKFRHRGGVRHRQSPGEKQPPFPPIPRLPRPLLLGFPGPPRGLAHWTGRDLPAPWHTSSRSSAASASTRLRIPCNFFR